MIGRPEIEELARQPIKNERNADVLAQSGEISFLDLMTFAKQCNHSLQKLIGPTEVEQRLYEIESRGVGPLPIIFMRFPTKCNCSMEDETRGLPMTIGGIWERVCLFLDGATIHLYRSCCRRYATRARRVSIGSYGFEIEAKEVDGTNTRDPSYQSNALHEGLEDT